MNAVAPAPKAVEKAAPRRVVSTATYTLIPIEQLHESKLNPRKTFVEAQLHELRDSIIAKGIYTPLSVRPRAAGGYEVAAGHRRLRAARLAKLTELPCTVREMTDEDFLELVIIENAQRVDVHPMEEAQGFQALLGLPNYTVETIASKLGKGETFVRQRLQLAKLILDAQKLFLANTITLAHAVILARLTPEDQAAFIDSDGNRDDTIWTYSRHAGGNVVLLAKEFQALVERTVYLELKKAPFNAADAQLLPKAGACAMCPKRTGFAPSLFPEIDSKKSDRCVDGACFQAKVAAHLQSQHTELAKAHGQAMFIQLEHHHGGRTKDPAGTLPVDKYFEVKAGTEGAIAAVVVDGQKPGTHRWITTSKPKERDLANPVDRSAAKYDAQRAKQNDTWQAQERARKKKLEKQRLLRRAQFEAVKAKVPAVLNDAWFRLLAGWVLVEMHHDALQHVCKLWAIVPKKQSHGGNDFITPIAKYFDGLKGMHAVQRALVELLLVPEVFGSDHFGGGASRLAGAAKLAGVNLAKVKPPEEKATSTKAAKTAKKTAPAKKKARR